jgi:hypothetical protein
LVPFGYYTVQFLDPAEIGRERAMRKIVMFNRVTADGYFAGTDGSLDWVVPDEELDRAAGEGMPGTGTILFGRRTYESFERFWPHVVEDTPDPHDPERRSPEILGKRPAVAQRRVDELEVGPPGGQGVPVGQRHASLRAPELGAMR